MHKKKLSNYLWLFYDSIWDYKTFHGERIIILTPIPEKLPIALAQVKACNRSEKLRNEIRQIICSLYQGK